jgi:hypothetical protein
VTIVFTITVPAQGIDSSFPLHKRLSHYRHAQV